MSKAPKNKYPANIPYKEGDPILSIRHVDITFGRGRKEFKAVSDANFDIFKGETVSLVGESGSGKTTIGRAIVRINTCSDGAIYYKGNRISGKMKRDPNLIASLRKKIFGLTTELSKLSNEHRAQVSEEIAKKQSELDALKGDDSPEGEKKALALRDDIARLKFSKKNDSVLLAKRKELHDAKRELRVAKRPTRDVVRKIQMIFQDPAASLNERATIEYIISEGLYNFKLYASQKDRMDKIEKIIKEVGLLPEHLTRYPHEFSGGQRQRVGIARCMVMEPEFIIADEPISALDVSIRAQVLNLMKEFQKSKGLTYLFIAHDLSIVRYISDRIVVIHLGKIVEIAKTEELFSHPLHPYTKSLMSAIPIPDPILEKNKELFLYEEHKKEYGPDDHPELVDIGDGHFIYGTPEEIEEYKRIRASEGK